VGEVVLATHEDAIRDGILSPHAGALAKREE
jgi:hypothetical protein